MQLRLVLGRREDPNGMAGVGADTNVVPAGRTPVKHWVEHTPELLKTVAFAN
jgi:hypothetical protein